MKRGLVGWQLQIAYAAEKRTGYCSRRHRCSENTNPTRPGGDRGGAAPQEENNGMVAEARPHGNAHVPSRLFARWRIVP